MDRPQKNNPHSAGNALQGQALIRVQLMGIDESGELAPVKMAGGGLATSPTAGGVTAHGDLTGLTADDHTQYALLAGRGLSQSLCGGAGTAGILGLFGHFTNNSDDYGRVQIARLELVPLSFEAAANVVGEFYLGASTGIGAFPAFNDFTTGKMRVCLFTNTDPTDKQILMHDGVKFAPVTLSDNIQVKANTGTIRVLKIYDKTVPSTPVTDLPLVYDGTGYDTTVLKTTGGGFGVNNTSHAQGVFHYPATDYPTALTALAANASATRKFLNEASKVPAWDTLLASDVIGVTAVGSATAGTLGETARGVASGSYSGATGNWTNHTSISLTAGDWDVSSVMVFDSYGSNATICKSAISIVGGTSGGALVGDDEGWCDLQGVTTSPDNHPTTATVSIPSFRINVASTTTVYLNRNVTYSTGNANIYGRISARRVR